MPLCLVHLLFSFCRPVFGYAIWFRKRPTHISVCIRTLCPRVAEYTQLYRASRKNSISITDKIGIHYIISFSNWRHHVSCAGPYFPGYDLSTYFRLMAAIFDLSLIRTSDSLRSSLVVSPDLENMGIAVGISLLSCIEAEICVISYLLLVNGSHLWFLMDPNIGHSYEYYSRAAQPRKHGYSRWNFVAITYTTEDKSFIYVLPVHGRHFDFWHEFLSSVIFVISGNICWFDGAFFIQEFI